MEKNPRGFTGDEKIGVSSLPPLPLAGKSARCSHSAGSFLASPRAARSVTRLRACPGSSHPVQGAATRSWEPKKNHIKASRVLKNQVKLGAMQKCKDETIPEPRPALRTLRFAAHRSVPFQFTSFFFFFFFLPPCPLPGSPLAAVPGGYAEPRLEALGDPLRNANGVEKIWCCQGIFRGFLIGPDWLPLLLVKLWQPS